MPWEGSEIFVADVHIQPGSGTVKVALGDPIFVAGKKSEISVNYPTWTRSGTLFFTSDEGGARFQNPWAYIGGAATSLLRTPLSQDFGEPQWFLGWSFGAALDDDGKFVLFTALKAGRSVLHVVDTSTKTSKEIDCPYAEIVSLRRAGQNRVVLVGTSIDVPQSLGLITFDDNLAPSYSTLKSTAAKESLLPPGLVSHPQPITLDVPGGEVCHVVYYPPTNPAYSGTSIEGEKPPCVVSAHGGPTYKAGQGLDKEKQFYTSRGWGW
jgi:dipeptidyl aminopeptidase/acylaminoacyl peptidase